MKTIILTTLPNSYQAFILKDILQNKGIVSFFRNETISSVCNSPGFQIEILVLEEDYEKAIDVFEEVFPYLVKKHTDIS